MKSELAAQRNVLERELANLEIILAPEPDWKALLALEGAKEHLDGESLREIETRCAKLRNNLSDNRIFSARERIVEAIALIRTELELNCDQEEQPCGEPASFALTDRPPRLPAAEAELESNPLEGAADTSYNRQSAGRTHIKTSALLTRGSRDLTGQKKVTIRVTPPESELGSVSARPGPRDDLTAIIGIDTATAQRMSQLGVRRISQIANWSSRDVASVRAALGLGKRIARENWIEQAAALAAKGKAFSDPNEQKPAPAELMSPVASATASILASLDRGQTRAVKPTNDKVTFAHAGRSDVAEVVAEAKVPAKPEAKLTTSSGVVSAESPASPLHHIRGIDSVLASRLSRLGVRTFSQIASWFADDVAKISVALHIGEQVTRDSWIEQAALLERGITTAYSRHVGDGEPLRSGAMIDWKRTKVPESVTTLQTSDEMNVRPCDAAAPSVSHSAIAHVEVEKEHAPTAGAIEPTDVAKAVVQLPSHVNENVSCSEDDGDQSDASLGDTREQDHDLNDLSDTNSLVGESNLFPPREILATGEHLEVDDLEDCECSSDPQWVDELSDERQADVIVGSDALYEDTDYVEADVEIVAGSVMDFDDVTDASGEAVGEDEAFDAKNYAGYHSHVREASVSILPRETEISRSRRPETDQGKIRRSALDDDNNALIRRADTCGLTTKFVRSLIGK